MTHPPDSSEGQRPTANGQQPAASGRLGTREWVGIAMLLLAVLISATFLNAGAGEIPPPRSPVLGTPLPTTTPFLAPTPTPRPPETIDPPEGAWLVEYFSLPGDVREAANAVDTLDLAFPAAPFGDLHDDSWMLVASHDIEAPAGPRQFAIEYDGAVTIYLDDAEILSANDPSQTRPLTVIFEHPGGSARLRIEVRDLGGPLALRWAGE